MKIIREARGFKPKIADSVFVAENAAIIGDVVISEKASIWYNVTIRGDVMPIRIGKETNIQDNSVIHGTYKEHGCTIGHRVTVGHGVILHGCEIQDACLIGMGSIIMDGAVIGEQSVVGAGSLVTEGKKFPPRSLILGRPATVKRTLTEKELAGLQDSADHYFMYVDWFK